MTMTFGELIKKYTWDQLKDLFFNLYPDEVFRVRHYAKAYTDLMKVNPLPTKYELHVKLIIYDRETNVHTGSVYGVIPDLKPQGDEFFINEFSIELTDWGEWVSMPIHESTLQSMPEQEIIAHCMHELTWCGYTNAYIQTQLKRNAN
jgi:hypothetical protein